MCRYTFAIKQNKNKIYDKGSEDHTVNYEFIKEWTICPFLVFGGSILLDKPCRDSWKKVLSFSQGELLIPGYCWYLLQLYI